MKILILGHKQHGKDTAAEYWATHFGLKFKSSSMAVCEIFLFDLLKDGLGYETVQECFEDRVNHRKRWYDEIVKYNDGENKLTKEILKENDCYVGMRSIEEFNNSKHLFNYIIWIDASKRMPLEDSESMTIPNTVATITIENNETEEEFYKELDRIGRILFKTSFKHGI